eukprot:CAMPEP_0183353504 /NCGR_PEP_ID=MMETSP0164_2-20130417/33290_1 /TAXON_ID=221442 /ORGANISM="Coccolithus pelagicus ssp braarudi, Strain PLY182g" /LENGTH=150 /DNA_ID=CAMNT_0025526179 /DNA_START=17 /DNA_END=469 /DNA_ORIENTATION=+
MRRVLRLSTLHGTHVRRALSAMSADCVPLDIYHRVSESTLQNLQEVLENFADSNRDADVDVDYAADVLSFNVGERAFVVNKQAPNKQLWLSSPVRGPLRYDFCMSDAAWLNTRDQHELLVALADDVEHLCGHRLTFGASKEAMRQLVSLR